MRQADLAGTDLDPNTRRAEKCFPYPPLTGHNFFQEKPFPREGRLMNEKAPWAGMFICKSLRMLCFSLWSC